MRELNSVFARAFSDPESYLRKRPSDDYLNSWLSDPNHLALVALRAGEVVGGLVAYVLHKFERDRREIYIYDLAVAEEYRRTGIATALIRRLQDIASDMGAYVIFVQADYGDDPAIALYQKMGTREEVLHFDIAVPHKPLMER
jgi:aminoglycoside 3-N-acetyltransferase I